TTAAVARPATNASVDRATEVRLVHRLLRRAHAEQRLLARRRRRLVKWWQRLRRSAWSAWNRRHRSTYAGDLSRVPSRDEIPELLNRRGLLGIAAEVGVKNGK